MAPTSRRSIVTKGAAVVSKKKKKKTTALPEETVVAAALLSFRNGELDLKQQQGKCNTLVAKKRKRIRGAKVAKKLCSHEACTRQVVKGGVCMTHGAPSKERKPCSHEGCANRAVRGGVCVTHGATKKRCSHVGCNYGPFREEFVSRMVQR
jgi:hypothetical protein